MNKINISKLKKIIKKYPKCFSKIIKSLYEDSYNFINLNFKGKTFSEKLYNFLYNKKNILGYCKICHKPTSFLTFNNGYRIYCSKKCSNNDKDVLIKAKKTKINKYGGTSYLSTSEGQQKFKKAMLKKFNVDHPMYCNKIKEKVKNTCLKKYGKENIFKTDKFKFDLKIKNKRKHSKLLKTFNNFINNKEITKEYIPLTIKKEFKGTDYLRKYKFKCKKCGNVFYDNIIKLNGILYHPRCLICHPKQISLFENEIFQYLKTFINNNKIITNTRSIIPPHELDIYFPEYKLAIELDGIYYHSNAYIHDKKYHLNKTEACEKQGIKLIHIFENEWRDKGGIVKRKLKYLLNIKDEPSIFARKCLIKKISTKISSDFLNKYHMQESCSALIKLGLYYNNNIVAVMTFGKLRLALGNKKLTNKNNYELIRYCVGEKNVIGAAGKLFNYFIKKYNPNSVISYANRRYSNKDSAFYPKLGFKFVSFTAPNYWYVKNDKVYYRFNFRKNTLKDKLKKFDPTLTEWQNMQNNGFNRIWDCGNIKYLWHKKGYQPT